MHGLAISEVIAHAGDPIHHALGVRALLAALSCGLLFAGLVVLQIGTGRAPRVFANKLMLWLGARSYSFYLIHIWVLLEIDHIRQWEKSHDGLPEGGWLLFRTGWDARSQRQDDFLNADETGPDQACVVGNHGHDCNGAESVDGR